MEQTRKLLTDLRETLEVNPVVGRQWLRHILVEPIRVGPGAEDGVLHFDFSGVARFAKWDLSERCDVILAPHIHREPVRHNIPGRITRPTTCRVQQWCPRSGAQAVGPLAG